MKRREFLTATTAAGFTVAAGSAALAADATSNKELLELRLYKFSSAAKLQAFDSFLSRVAIPALNRAGIRPVGVFKLLKADNPDLKLEADSTDLYVLLPHKSAGSVLGLIDRLKDDSSFVDNAGELIEAPKSDPAYARYESSLFLGFDDAPKVEVPTKAATRVLQLRIYESHNEERALKKIEMFNSGGEIAIFRRVGLNIVFFGQALVGSKLPNLTYMLGFEHEEAMKKAWAAFGQDPAWKTLRDDPQYKDTVSTITNLVLRPAASSQI
jgi:hypothetical protein